MPLHQGGCRSEVGKLGILGPDAPNLHRMRIEARAAVKAARLVPNRAERKAAKKAAMKAYAEAFWTKPALTIVFDREGWSPALFRWLAEIGIAIITWRKGDPGEDWPVSDFKKMPVPVFDSFGVKRVREYLVAEKNVLLDAREKKSGGGRKGKGKGKRKAKADGPDAIRIQEDYLEIREIRRLRSDGKQASFVTTDFSTPLERIAGALFSRWAQENFFKYAEEWFDLGRSTVHELEDVDPEEPVRNRVRKKIDADLKKKIDLAEKKRADADALRTVVEECKERASRRTPRSREASRKTVEEEKRRAAPGNLRKLLIEIASLDAEIADLKLRQKEEPVHVPVGTLSGKDRPKTIRQNENVLVERTKVIAYRTVSWMSGFLPARGDGQRSKKILRSLFNADADIIPEPENGILRVRVLGLPNNAADATIARLFEGLNATNTIFPGTKLRLVYELPGGGKT